MRYTPIFTLGLLFCSTVYGKESESSSSLSDLSLLSYGGSSDSGSSDGNSYSGDSSSSSSYNDGSGSGSSSGDSYSGDSSSSYKGSDSGHSKSNKTSETTTEECDTTKTHAMYSMETHMTKDKNSTKTKTYEQGYDHSMTEIYLSNAITNSIIIELSTETAAASYAAAMATASVEAATTSFAAPSFSLVTAMNTSTALQQLNATATAAVFVGAAAQTFTPLYSLLAAGLLGIVVLL